MSEFSLQKLRVSKRLKQSELGEILGIKQSYISDLEGGKKKLTPELLDLIKEKFGDIEEFYVESEDETKKNLETALGIINKQLEILQEKDRQLERFITLLENQLNK